MMRKGLFLLVSVGLMLTFMGNAQAAKDLTETVKDGCRKELESYCKDVTPGEGRVLACLYAYEDKLSGGCVYALYDASVQLERAVTALTYLANECRDDLKEYCASVEAGEGRLLKCLEQHDAKISQRCKQAVKDVGLK